MIVFMVDHQLHVLVFEHVFVVVDYYLKDWSLLILKPIFLVRCMVYYHSFSLVCLDTASF